MTKIIKKSKLHYEGGFVVKGNKIINLPIGVVLELRKLEALFQRCEYLDEQEPYSPAPSLDGFVQQSERGDLPFDIKVETPTLDKKIKESLALAHEIEVAQNAGDFAQFTNAYKELLEFVCSDKFVEGTAEMRLDLPRIGDPLKLTLDKVMSMLQFCYDIMSEKNCGYSFAIETDCDGDR